ncbi:MAG: 50S ribosomal protein L32 [Firmicutes bacterium]|nr:50S ribosomal protein L32 [Bacillota bacterium]
MANPTSKFGKSRTRKRRANWKIKGPELIECEKCHALRRPHRVCLQCGYYDGRQVVSVKEKKKA